jgi:hypothetical protein
MQVEEQDEYLAAYDALKLLRDTATDTLAPAKIEEAVWNRISEYENVLGSLIASETNMCRRYPAAFRRHVHFTKAYLPLDIAKALSVNPSLVQRAVEAFYTRDAAQLRVSSSQDYVLSKD